MMRTMLLVLLVPLCAAAAGDTEWNLVLRGLDGYSSRSSDAASGPGAPSPGLSFLLSALVPGAGQVYQGRVAGWAFVAMDAALWGGYAALRGRGHDLEDDYRAFADAHYDLTNPDFGNDAERGWYEWWDFFRTIDTNFIWADTVYSQDILEASRADRVRYYQDIESSNAYIFGWDDWAPDEFGNGDFWWQDADGLHFAYVSPFRDQYRRMRAKADSRLRWAGRLVGLAVVMRAATAIEALRSARAARTPALTVSVDWTRREPALVVAWRRALR